MGRRHAGLAFMGGKFVFPGGRIEPSDRMMSVAGALSQRADDALRAKLPRAPHHLGRSLALAAIRETYEETGHPSAGKHELAAHEGEAGMAPTHQQLQLLS
jgi:8-oxo-dGTP pyrophosphatase MutT (NUDIX family)